LARRGAKTELPTVGALAFERSADTDSAFTVITCGMEEASDREEFRKTTRPVFFNGDF